MQRWLRVVPALLAGAGCFLVNNNQIEITYDLDPQEYAQDFGSATGTVPSVDCAANAALCSRLPMPSGASASCDPASKKCQITADVRLTQRVNLSTQQTFPSAVANSSVIQQVKVNAVRYWPQSNTLSFNTPPIDLYIGPQTIQHETDSGAARLGTIPPLPARTLPCNKQSPCNLALTEAGKNVLGTLAKDFKTPFNVLIVAHIVAHAGDPVPAGKIDLLLRPELAFVLPLK